MTRTGNTKSEILTLNLQDRDLNIKTKTIRNDGWVPGALYGPETESTPVQMTVRDFSNALHHEGEIYQIKSKKGTTYVKFDEIQRDPVTRKFVHFSMVQLPNTGESSIEIRVDLTGDAKGVKAGGTLLLLKDHIELHGKVTDLPTKLEFDVSTMEIGGKLTVGDLNIPSNCNTDLQADEVIAVLRPPKTEEEETTATTTEATEGETTEEPAATEEENFKKSA
ncbi:MAG: 50S ribosomal protein L25 [Bacteriovoracaceae bacterium]